MTLGQWINQTAPSPEARMQALTHMGGATELDLAAIDPAKTYTHGWRGEAVPDGAVHTSSSYAHDCYWWEHDELRRDFVN